MPDPSFRELPTWLLSQAARRSHRVLHDRLGQAGASAYEYRLLSALHTVGEATQAELGRLTMLDRRDVAVTVRGLIASGAVTRRGSPDDARVQIVALTRRGRRRYQELEELMQDVQDAVFGSLTSHDRERLTDYLARLSDELAKRAIDGGA